MTDERHDTATAAQPSGHQVAAYLRRHPNFLEHYPDLALSLVLPRQERQASSLASYQLEVLRDKNRELNKRLAELFANAQENERLTVRTHQLGLALMRAGSAADTWRAMVACLREDFAGDRVQALVFAPVEGLDPSEEWITAIPSADARMAPFRDFLLAAEPLCGRLNPDKLAVLFGGAAPEAASVALLPLAGYGLVAVGSRDANRFFPGMGTLFLRLMSESLVAALARFG
jgi:uncharacterized protein YigA (DUF484 family)